jgi:hypothetical protein
MKAHAARIVMLSALFLVIVLGYFGGKRLFVKGFESSDLNVKPWVSQSLNFTESNGQETTVAKVIRTRRSDGALFTETTPYGNDGKPGMTMKRFDLPNGYTGMIVDSLHAKMTGFKTAPRLAGEKANLINPPPQCAFKGETVEGTDTLLGNTAIRIVKQNPSTPLERIEMWRFPEFNCETVQIFEQKRSGPEAEWQTVLGAKLTSFIPTDANPTEATWKNYGELKPSDLKNAMLLNGGTTPEQCPKCFAEDARDQESDTAYASMQPR